jgi:photosystem I P700 chlorophyll a apoprotein A2
LGHSAAQSSSQRLFHFLGSAHDLEALAAGRSAGSAVRALLLGHWLHLATVLCWLTGIAAHAGFQANLDLWLDNPVRFGSIAHALWDPHFGSTAFPVNELPASGFPFWARSVGFVAGGQLLAFGGALEAGSVGLAYDSLRPGRAFPFRCSAARVGLASLLWAGHLGWAAAAPRPAQLLSLVGDLSPLSRAVLLTDTIHHHVAVAAIGLWVSLGGAFGLVSIAPVGQRHLNRQVAAACLPLASIVFWNAHAVLWLPSAGWVHFSLLPCNALFAHHLWVGSALAAGGCVHFSAAGAVPAARALAPHLSWIGLFLGFHALGPYVHSDAVLAFGDAGKALLIQPVAVQSLQAADLCPADFLVQHAAALGIHTSLLVLLQGGSFPASRLDPDKRQRGFGFACDGPGRGGTCDISGWAS